MADPASNPLNDLIAALVKSGATGIHGPYEDAMIAGFRFMEKLIDGQTAEQKAQAWQKWFDFWEFKWLGIK